MTANVTFVYDYVTSPDINIWGYTYVNQTDPPKQAIIFLYLEVPATVFVAASNILVLFLISKMTKFQKMCNTYFVTSLTVANLTAGLLGLPVAMLTHWSTLGGDALCKIYHYFMQVSECAEVYSLVAIAIDRHRVVVRHRTDSHDQHNISSSASVSIIWLFAVTYGLTAAFIHEETTRVVKDGPLIITAKDCYTLKDVVLVRCVLIFDFLLLVLLPLSLMGAYYSSIVRFIEREQQHSSSYTSNHKKRVIRTVLLLMAIFIVFNVPLHIFEMYIHFIASHLSDENLIREILEYMAFLNFGVNAFAYALISANFKMASKRCHGCCISIQVHPALNSSGNSIGQRHSHQHRDPRTTMSTPVKALSEAASLPTLPSISGSAKRNSNLLAPQPLRLPPIDDSVPLETFKLST